VATGWLGQAGVKGRLGHSRWWRKAPNRAGERVNGEATGRTVAGGECVDSLVMGEGEKGLTGRARLLKRGRSRWSEGGHADGWGRPINGRGGEVRARAREMGRVGRSENGSAGEREGVGPDPAQPRGWGEFPFYF
jgi:hypothetical protein